MQILDTTIRDGSYAVDFKFSTMDVKDAVKKLARLGIGYIEIGHGQGINASSPEHGISMCSDEEYLAAAKEVSADAKIGMFCIPGIARTEDLERLAGFGLDFVRIGVPVDQAEKALPFIDEAKKNHIIPMVNFMKTYAYDPAMFASNAKYVFEKGAEAVYIVDSAGCMLPEEIDSYVEAVRTVCPSIRLGFHAHNNIGLAVSNSIHCYELKFDYIDCTFQGLGRSIGNASTEMFVMSMKKKFGDDVCDIDVPRLLEYGYVFLKNSGIRREILSPLDLVCGYSGFHSSFLKDIYRCCEEKNVDPLRLIIAYSRINQKTIVYDELCRTAESLPGDDFEGHPYSFRQYFTSIYNS